MMFRNVFKYQEDTKYDCQELLVYLKDPAWALLHFSVQLILLDE